MPDPVVLNLKLREVRAGAVSFAVLCGEEEIDVITIDLPDFGFSDAEVRAAVLAATSISPTSGQAADGRPIAARAARPLHRRLSQPRAWAERRFYRGLR